MTDYAKDTAMNEAAQQTQRQAAAQQEMPRYRSHKLVWALKITGIEPTIPAPEQESDGSTRLLFSDNYAPRKVSRDYMRKHTPQVGGYYVVYEGGYESWSPADVFEAGYTPDGRIGGMSGGSFGPTGGFQQERNQ